MKFMCLVLISCLSLTCAENIEVSEKTNTEQENGVKIGKSLQESKGPEIPKIALANANTERIKKQSPTMRDCDKSICGPMVSAFGPNLDVIRDRMKMDMPLQLNSESNARSAADVPQARTWDLLNLGGFTNPGQSVSNNQPSSGYGVPSNTYYKPPTFSSLADHPIHSMLAQHGLGQHGLLQPGRVGPPVPPNGIWIPEERYKELIDRENKCLSKNEAQKTENKLPPFNIHLRLELQNGSLIPIQYAQGAGNEELKVTTTSDNPQTEDPVGGNRAAMGGQSQNFNGEDLQAHLRKIQEIKDEINRLNMRAHKMLEQEEQKVKSEEMRKMNYGRNGQTGFDNFADLRQGRYDSPYGGHYGNLNYGNYPNYLSSGFRPITSYPQNREDTEFFMHLMDQFKKMGVTSGSLQGGLPATLAKEAEKKTRSSEDLISDLVNGKNQDKTENPNV